MKQVLMAALVAVTMVSSAFAAGKNKGNAYAQNNFSREFAKATNISWSAGADYTKATFNINNDKMEVFYNNDGEKFAESTSITLEELPVRAKRAFAKKYTGYTVVEAIRLDNEDGIAYYVSAKNDKESVILKVNDNEQLSTFKKTTN